MDTQTFHLINFILAFFCAMLAMASATTVLNNRTDKASLLAFKLSITNDPSEALRSWNDTTDFCNWEGISCSKKNKGRVVSINLSSRSLTGYIPSSIDNLSFLHHLDLNQNQFFGKIPPSIGNLSSLQLLDLSKNQLEGGMPKEIGNHQSLEYLRVSINKLSGELPATIFNLSSTYFFSVAGNTFEEYGVGSPISFMGDVYSYGILLIEMFTGTRPVDNLFKDGLTLHKFVEMAIPDRVMEVIDPKLQLQLQDIPNNGIQSRRTTYECLTSILQLSLLCSKEFARERISMVDAARELCLIRNVYFKGGLHSSGPQNEYDR